MNEQFPEKEPRVRVVSLLPHVVSRAKAIAAIAALARRKAGGYVCLSTVHMVMEAYDDPVFAARVNNADYVVTDGMPLVWVQKLAGARDAERVRGNDLMAALLRHAAENGLSVGFYGGRPETLAALEARAASELPDLKIVCAFAPPFRPLTDEEDARAVEQINRADPDLLFVGLGCPKQENWMAAHRGRLRAVLLGVGAAFDFYAKNLRESPVWMSRLGLEWLFRLTQEPRRLWRRYLILNPRFVWLASLQLAGLKKFGAAGRSENESL